MNDERVEFYDPIYQEGVVFEQGLPNDRFLSQELSLDPREIVKTTEFVRLAHLRQVGLHWLAFPSASHVYYANAIGCWRIGRIAEKLIRFQLGEKKQTLRGWLIDNNLRGEYYLSLLLHQIGRGPLGGVVDKNEMVFEILSSAGIEHPDFEHRSIALLRGEGPFAQEWSESRRLLAYGSGLSITELIRDIGDQCASKLCLPAIYYLIAGDDSYASVLTTAQRENLRIIRNIVGGLINLGRLDRYARNAYFSGLSREPFNIRGFLSNVYIKRSISNKQLNFFVVREGASNLTNLLSAVRQIDSVFIRNPRALALQAMLDHALTLFLKSTPSAQERTLNTIRIVLMDDNSLIQLLIHKGPPACRELVRRAMSMSCYEYIGRWQTREKFGVRRYWKKLISETYNSASDTVTPIVCWTDEGVSPQSADKGTESWLDIDKLYIERTDDEKKLVKTSNIVEQNLKYHPDFRGDFEHLQKTAPVPAIWAFSAEGGNLKKIKREINELLSGEQGFEEA